MHIDNALALNERITTLPGTYYFAVPCSATEAAEDGSQKPLIPNWESGKRIVLLGHSFGGATIRLFSELLAAGAE